MDNTELLLKEITEASGVSGYETEIRNIMTREMNGLVDEIEYDRMGSIMGRKVGSSKSPRIMIISHMDFNGNYYFQIYSLQIILIHGLRLA